MARIEPFTGLTLRDPATGAADPCAAPPYDVLDDAERDAYAARSPANVVHLTLPQDGAGEDRYAVARRTLAEMLQDGRLCRDPAPAFYLQDVTFRRPGGAAARRLGLLARVRIEPLGGSIRGHEEVMPKPLEDRTRLLEATRMNLEPIFLLYRDPQGDVDERLRTLRTTPPDATAVLGESRYELRRVTDTFAAAVAERLADPVLYVADGHHRYTVAARYHEAHPELPGAAWRLALLVRAEDPGLLILPTHRFVADPPAGSIDALTALLSLDYDLAPVPAEELPAALARAADPSAFGVWLRPRSLAAVATPRAAVHQALVAVPPPLGALDVTILHRHLLDPPRLGHVLACRYVRGEADPIARAVRDEVPVVFLLRPPAVETVLAVADRGLFMPPKSTYFEPKAASGQVLSSLADGAPA